MSKVYSSVFTKHSQPESLRVGVIGVGNMGQHHTRVLNLLKDTELVGVADINVERGLDTASKYQVRFFEDYKDLLPHVDAVCVAVPTLQHYAVGMTCLEAGVHILMEKPIAASIAEAEFLVNTAAEANRILQVGHIERFNPAFQELTKVLKTEDLLALEAHRMSPYSHRANDVSVVLDLMIHDIDLLLDLVASPVVKLTASGSSVSSSGNLDYVTATLGFANGIVATLTASKVTHKKLRSIVAHCKNSLTEADFLNNEILIHRQTTADYVTDYGQVLYRQDGLIEKVYTSNIEPLHAELEHFIHCVGGGNQPSVGGEQALKALRLASLIEKIAFDGLAWHSEDSECNLLNTSMLKVS
ncbi:MULTISPECIES: Gfo/Idh/MocA family protein [Okeania]|uniref:Gfo/Idh/MocA family oxidoreductase n=2 Tax=Okeania TaxID=1458928 RepID=A0A3N6RCJ2_9CYAN|nr:MULTISPECIES: Gfo/Idh/MocA family oxidoreductase [Okeania]NET16856.1 Gfo/Idh/MocA family oxidoreductase [Okeania sp. SIO1H6]NES76111.1 Gfo/Idh/MocA family oxidoreductase [Okeania sp. SIO1H4]NET19410.1 Gfo/Idh/MocA family oxidoreductase [Okeania sp. SIO1H5]NET76092.1 Gfo/Idh/MocA family oxidoreductase [Okeania sp. SIO1F9]NET95945.1 Gfo/Idh/MocA family oxidoreductase [Okeania sp. SIO1H2]